MPINTIEGLRKHLQWALELEHTTIPPYLCALYSIKEGTNQDAQEVLKSIIMEEMLHMTLVSNILNAVGGSPQLDKPDFIAQYPAFLPHSNKSFHVPLAKLSPEALDALMNIERPAAHGTIAEDENYETIGQFYTAIEQGLIYLTSELGSEKVFVGDPSKQVCPDKTYYGGTGRIIRITDLDSALAAMKEIVEQGEGVDYQSIWDGDHSMFHPQRKEVGHYFRLQQIKLGRRYKLGDTAKSGPSGDIFHVDWAGVYGMCTNPKSKDFPEGSEIYEKMTNFNKIYSDMLRLLQRCFNGEPGLLAKSVGIMYELRAKAVELMQLPVGEGATTAGPSFEYIPTDNQNITTNKKIVIRANGPYVVYGNIPLSRKTKITADEGEALTWLKEGELETDEVYVLCRCGKSSSKPFCDGTHMRFSFNGTEVADSRPISERQETLKSDGITVKSDRSVCIHAAFCTNKTYNMRKLLPRSNDLQVRTQIISMVEHCPSGTLTYTLNEMEKEIEPDLPEEISVAKDSPNGAGPLWVTGGIEIQRADGQPVERRNRVTLCRCGYSKNKPFCDGTHHKIKWL